MYEKFPKKVVGNLEQMCYDRGRLFGKRGTSVNEERNDIPMEEQEQPSYRPRPTWQVWAARVAAVIVFVAFLLYCWQIANGGAG